MNKNYMNNLKLEAKVQLLEQKVKYYEFELRNMEKKLKDVPQENRDNLKKLVSEIPEELLRKFSLKCSQEFPHLKNNVTKQIDIDIDKIEKSDFKGML